MSVLQTAYFFSDSFHAACILLTSYLVFSILCCYKDIKINGVVFKSGWINEVNQTQIQTVSPLEEEFRCDTPKG